MSPQSRRILEEGLAETGVPLSGEQVDRLAAYLDELLAWNHRMNLVGPTDEKGAVTRHLLDSLAAWPILQHDSLVENATIADVGSGAGLPGIPVAIAAPRHDVTLIERSAKKGGFLLRAIEVAEARRVRVVTRDLRETSDRFDILLLRAVATTDRGFVDLLCRHATRGGRIYLYKGRREVIDEELERLSLPARAVTVHRLSVPGLDAERHLVELRPRYLSAASAARS